VAHHAIVIGPHEYEQNEHGVGLARHGTIRHSVIRYGEVLRADRLWKDGGRVDVLTQDDLRSPITVMRAVQEAADRARKGDTLLVVYVGHGAFWSDAPDGHVHFALNWSLRDVPYTWLSSWYIYRAIRLSSASLKVLIADCCYSNLLPNLGDAGGSMLGALAEVHEGTCVLTALGNRDEDVNNLASALGCTDLPEGLGNCTPFSGHLLSVLRKGTRNSSDTLTLGMIRDAVQEDMSRCSNKTHDQPRMILNDTRESTPLFGNNMDRRRRQSTDRPTSAELWAKAILGQRDYQELLNDPRMAGQVVTLLSKESDTKGRQAALEVNHKAEESFFADQRKFATYWAEASRAQFA
jgi:hypothetical protein